MPEIGNKVAQQFKEDLDEKSIKFENDLHTHMVAWADKNQVEIILRNLIGNAVKFTPEGGLINISGKLGADNIEINVKDNGIGMSPIEVGNLFHPTNHFTTNGTNQEKGTGIGLLITKEMIINNGEVFG
jgi:signal transduction histidine kinase